MKKLLTLLLLVALTQVSCQTTLVEESTLQTVNKERYFIVQFIEGFLYGVIEERYDDLDVCMADVEVITLNLKHAIDDLNKKTFKSMKRGLMELSTTIKLIPQMVHDCKQVGVDLSKIARMAEIFAHPFKLIYKVGKNLIINGVDIFSKIMKALLCYERGDFFHFGMYIGEAMEEVLLSAKPMIKGNQDSSAYEFLTGFLNAMGFQKDYDQESLYNNIDGLGRQIFGPVENAMKIMSQDKPVPEKTKYALHELSHVFLDGTRELSDRGGINEDLYDTLEEYSHCLADATSGKQELVQQLMNEANVFYNMEDFEKVGAIVAKLVGEKCRSDIDILHY